jgi:DNA-directed RNA polymerase subunit RPC12/RpoP
VSDSSSALEYISFNLVDPRLVMSGDVHSATIMTIGALSSGGYVDLMSLGMSQRVTALNDSLTDDIEHQENRRSKLGRHRGIIASYSLYYCALCGGQFERQRCPRCKISMEPRKTAGIVGSFPDILPKIVKYAQAHGHRFLRVPPRP